MTPVFSAPKPPARPPTPRRFIKRGRVKRANPKRKAKAFAHAYHSKERVAFVQALPCCFCNALSPIFGITAGSSHNAHTQTGGTRIKAHYTMIVPLCATHHSRYDLHQPPFAAKHIREAMQRHAAVIEALWLAAARGASPKHEELLK